MDDQTERRGPRHSTGAEPDLINGVAPAELRRDADLPREVQGPDDRRGPDTPDAVDEVDAGDDLDDEFDSNSAPFAPVTSKTATAQESTDAARPVSATRASEQVAPLTSELTLPGAAPGRSVGGFVADLFGRGAGHRSRRPGP